MGQRVDQPFVRLDFLDALRCFAALYVILYHITLIPDPDLLVPEWLVLFAGNGGSGVTLFFVLSAFALSYSLDARHGEPNLSLHFYIRRFFRIAPLFYFVLVAYLIRDWAMFNVVHRTGDVLINASMLFNLLPEHTLGIVWASWTIGVEVLFYIAFPLIHYFVRNLKDALTLFLVATLCAYAWVAVLDGYGTILFDFTPEEVLNQKSHGLLRHLPSFALGFVCYRIYFDRLIHLGRSEQRRLGRLLLASFVVLATALLTGTLNAVLWDGLVWQAIAFSLLVMGLGLTPSRVFVNALTVKLGKMSYSLYLLHPTILLWLSPVYYWLYAEIPITTGAFLGAFFLTVIVLAGLSTLSYKQIERRGIGWGERVIEFLQSRQSVSASA